MNVDSGQASPFLPKRFIAGFAWKLPAVLCTLVTGAFADQFGNFTYVDNGTSITITDYPTFFYGPVVIPGTINGKPVTGIGVSAFADCAGIESVTIPSGVKNIASSAFKNCGLGSVTIPSSVTTIGVSAFEGSRLNNVTIPAGVTSISNSMFLGCYSLTSVTIPSGVTLIGDSAFSNCYSLTVLVIPSTVVTIGASAFSDCDGLATLTIPPSVTSIRSSAFKSCTGLTSVVIPANVVRVWTDAFYSCTGLTNLTIQPGVVALGDFAFGHCDKLNNVTIPSSVTMIDRAVFSNCGGLNSIVVDAANPNFSSIGGVLFNKTQTRLVQYPGGLAGAYVIPSGVNVIANYAFAGCGGLTSVEVPSSVTQIEYSAFAGCKSLTNAVIPSGVTSMGSSVFYYCDKLRSVTLPPGISTIGDYSFTGCASLKSLTIPPLVSGIGTAAFYNCGMLSRLNFSGNAPVMGSIALQYVAVDFTIYYFNGKSGFTSPTWLGYPSVNMGEETALKTWLITGGFPYDSNLQSDFNGDGMNLLMAYALNLDPNQNLSGSMPKPLFTAGEMSLRFYAGTAGVSYAVEASGDMVHWSTDGVTISGPDANQNRTATVDHSGPNRFMRLAVSN